MRVSKKLDSARPCPSSYGPYGLLAHSNRTYIR